MYDAYNLILKLLIILLLRVAHDLYITRFQCSSFAHALSAFERWIEARTAWRPTSFTYGVVQCSSFAQDFCERKFFI